MMKKIVVGLGVLGVFIMYSLWVRHELPTIAKPSSLTAAGSTSTSNAANTVGSSSGGTPSGTPGTSTGQSGGSGSPTVPTGQYKDGTYTGSVTDAFYGNVQVSATVSGGKLTGVSFLQYPDTHDTSVMINQQAMPYLQQEAIQSQSANVQIISGATFTSQAFQQSLGAALSHAQA